MQDRAWISARLPDSTDTAKVFLRLSSSVGDHAPSQAVIASTDPCGFSLIESIFITASTSTPAIASAAVPQQDRRADADKWVWEAAAGPGKEDPFRGDWDGWQQEPALAILPPPAATVQTTPEWISDADMIRGWLVE